MKKIALPLLCGMILLFSGCAQKSADIVKKSDATASYSDTSDMFRILLDRKERLLRMGYIGWKKSDPDDFFVVYDGYGFSPPYYIPTHREMECGRGSLIGWVGVIYPPIFFKKRKGILCNYPFTRTTGIDMGKRIFMGLLTYGTSVVTAGTMHTVVYDPKAFDAMLHRSGLKTMRNQIEQIKDRMYLKRLKIAVLQTTPDRMEEDLHDLIGRLITSHQKNDAVAIVDDDEKVIVSYAPMLPTMNRSGDLQRFFDALYRPNLIETADHTIAYDLQNALPSAPKYTPPPTPTLIKGRYETKKAFLKRVKRAKQTWQKAANERYRDYMKKVRDYKERIEKLQRKMRSSKSRLAKRWEKYLQAFDKNYAVLAKLGLILRSNPARIENPRYDPDSQKLYVRVCRANKQGCGQFVAQNVGVEMAKRIIEQNRYSLEPILQTKAQNIRWIGWQISSDDSRKILRPTNRYFKPVEIRLHIPNDAMRIPKVTLPTLTNETIRYANAVKIRRWVVQTLDTDKIDLPEWFAHPDKSLAGYGMGADKKEALAEALQNLSLELGAHIKSQSRYETRIDQREWTKHLTQTRQIVTTDHRLKKGTWRIDKMDFKNGWWFVKVILSR